MNVGSHGVIRFCPQCGSDTLEHRVPRKDDKERQVCVACGYVHYVGPALAAGMIVHRDGRLCLVRRAHEPGFGKWTFPGGFVDVGEEPSDAAARETLEEASCTAEVERLLGVYRSEGPKGKPVVLVVYVGRWLGQADGGSEEVKEVRWFAPADIPWREFAFTSTVEALKDYLADQAPS